MWVEISPSGFDHPRPAGVENSSTQEFPQTQPSIYVRELNLPPPRFCTIRWKLYLRGMPVKI